MIKKIVLFKGGVETQGFFSEQLEKAFIRMGYEVFMFDYEKEAKSSFELLHFVKRNETAMVTFNFHGICNEDLLRDDDDIYIWDDMEVPCYNIVVDHPFYYDRFMPQLPKRYYQISIDKNHIDYMKRFYKDVKLGPFIPLGGTELNWEGDARLKISDRPVDVVFTGSWADPEFFAQYMRQEGEEYEQFYMGILKKQLENPDMTFEEVFEPIIKAEAEDVDDITDEQLRDLYSRLIHFDMYVRYYFRGEVVKALVDSGIKVRCIGGGWDKLDCQHPENIDYIEYSPSIDCLREIRQAKLSLNVMPWFKRGAHDRIFNSMLNGAVCITDSSEYLDEILCDGENSVIYSLTGIEKIPELVHDMLSDEKKLQAIADAGYKLALAHTWENRAREIADFIRETQG